MERNKILILAKQAGMAGLATTVVCEIAELERFARLVAEEEREACAHTCDEGLHQVRENGWIDVANERARCAAAIRARSNA